ncbi:MAG: AMP-binding protein [Clostridium sp.]|jgi:long-chain acyl-CoA synthetase|nr:AMP-binding protein [Clostridium sp.]
MLIKNKPYPWNERIPWIDSFAALLDFIEGEYPQKPAFIYERGRQSHTVSFAEFVGDVRALAAALSERDWAGKRYAILGESSYEWILYFFAGILAGAVAVPLDKELPAQELQRRILQAEIEITLYSQGCEFLAQGLDCAQKLPLEAELPRSDSPLPKQAPQAPAAVFFTSGTTGHPMAAVLSQKNLMLNVSAASRSFWEEGVNLLVLPLHHVYGLSAAVLAPMIGGSCSAICPSVKYVKRFLSEYPPDCVFGVPMLVESVGAEIWRAAARQGRTGQLKAMLALVNALQGLGLDFSKRLMATVRKGFGGRLKTLVSGGGELSPRYYKLFRGLGVNLLNGYGITECGPIVAINRNFYHRDGSVGLPLCNTKVRIADDGEIQVRGESVFLGYYNDEEATKRAFTQDGWFKTGDIGRFDGDGFLYVTGRIKNLIVTTNGENVSPEELENRLGEIEGVAEVLVYQQENEIVAEIYPEPGFADAQRKINAAVDELNRYLPLYSQIARVKLRDTQFPRTTSMKIMRQ